MASGRLSFSIALNLMTNQFKQGAEQVKNSLRNIQYQVLGMAAALGAGGFGLTELVSKFVDVARETNRARMALRNISGDAAIFGKNMSYLTGLAGQYGQDLNTLTTNFARFSAASNAAGVSLSDQEKIYSSVTKSITAFGLSGDEANLTFMALGQMMSKGKISSEELRRQMGERIPIAMQAMANAAGVSIQQLDKMLKNGDIYSKDILPRFAEELDKLTGSVNVDNIETSVNRLKTAFIKLTEDLRIGEFYKKIVDGAAGMLGKVQSLMTTFAGVIVGGVLAKIIKGYLNYQASAMAAHTRVTISARKAAWAEELAGRNLTKKQQTEILKRAVSINTAYLNSGGVIKNFGITAVTALRTIGTALASIAPMAILMALGAIVGKIIEARKETERLKGLFGEYNKEIKNAGNDDSELIKIRALLRIINDKKNLQTDIKNAQNELLKILDLEKWNRDDVNAKLRTKINLLKEAARAEVASRTIAETEKAISDKARGSNLTPDQLQKIVSYFVRTKTPLQEMDAFNAYTANKTYKALSGLGYDTSNVSVTNNLIRAVKEAGYLNPQLNAANKQLVQSSMVLNRNGNTTPFVPTSTEQIGGSSSKVKEEINNTLLEWAKGLIQKMRSSVTGKEADPNGFEINRFKNIIPQEQSRDTTFDYKKTELDKLQEQEDIIKKRIEELRDAGAEGLTELKRKEGELTSLSEALKVAELKEDLENLNKNIFSESIDGITGFANSIDSIANSWERVANSDLSGWEKMIAIINALGDSVKGLTGAWETYKAIKELIDTKEKASAALSLVNSGKVIAASGSEATADLVAGTAKTFKANAGIPVVGAGIAIAGVAGILALLASLPKFEKGGIIGGSSYSGDKIFGRFNSGERVLTRPDQAYLTKVLKGGTTGGGNVEFKIKGKELVGILQQENTRARR